MACIEFCRTGQLEIAHQVCRACISAVVIPNQMLHSKVNEIRNTMWMLVREVV